MAGTSAQASPARAAASSVYQEPIPPQDTYAPGAVEQPLTRNGIIVVGGKGYSPQVGVRFSNRTSQLEPQVRAPGSNLPTSTWRPAVPGLPGQAGPHGGGYVPGQPAGSGGYLPGTSTNMPGGPAGWDRAGFPGGGFGGGESGMPGDLDLGRLGLGERNSLGRGRGWARDPRGSGSPFGSGGGPTGALGDLEGFGPERGPRIKFKGSDAGQNVTVPPGYGGPPRAPQTGSGDYREEGKIIGKGMGQAAGEQLAGPAGKEIGGKIGGFLGEEKGKHYSKTEGAHTMITAPSSEVTNDGTLWVNNQAVHAPGHNDQGSNVTGGQSAGTTGGHSTAPNEQNQSTAPAAEKKKEENQSKDPNQSKKEENQSKSTDARPNPNAGRPADDSSGGGTPRSSSALPADDGSGGAGPRSNIYMPADDSAGGGTPRSVGYRPADDSAGTGDPRSHGASVGSRLNLKLAAARR